MESGKLYPANRYFEVPRENRLFFNESDKKMAEKRYEPI
jgi:hypothetical protein